MRQTVAILGIPVDSLDTAGVLLRIEQFIQERRFHQVATANVDFLINAMEDPILRDILRRCDLVTPDGMPLVWASRRLGAPLPERVTGADIVPALAGLAAQRGYRIYMLGARPEVAQRAKQKLIETYPALEIVGCVSPEVAPLDRMDDVSLLQGIIEARPDILLVAFGNPKQEKWIDKNRAALAQVPLCLGVGGTFDFIAGSTTRAPIWMQRTGLEWLYRFSREPGRLWRRYTRDIVHFGRFVARQLWAMRGSQRLQCAFTSRLEQNATVMTLQGGLRFGSLEEFQRAANAAIDLPSHLALEMQDLTELDGAGLGTLINLAKRAAYQKRRVRIVGLAPRLKAIFHITHADEAIEQYATIQQALDAAASSANEPCALSPAELSVPVSQYDTVKEV